MAQSGARPIRLRLMFGLAATRRTSPLRRAQSSQRSSTSINPTPGRLSRSRDGLGSYSICAMPSLGRTYRWRRPLVASSSGWPCRPQDWFALPDDVPCQGLPLEIQTLDWRWEERDQDDFGRHYEDAQVTFDVNGRLTFGWRPRRRARARASQRLAHPVLVRGPTLRSKSRRIERGSQRFCVRFESEPDRGH
jgi:hypothetical protein